MNRGIRFASHERRATGDERIGSALILTVVLTSLLAMVGVLFVMMARVNQIATSGLSESKELDSAIETVIAKISEELVLDVPGVSATNLDYYDYPGSNDKWLASLEPSTDPNRWRQISDVTGFLNDKNFDTQDVSVDPPGIRKYIPEYPEINVDSDGEFLDEYGNPATEGLWADADGDGIADSKWIEVNDITSSQGRPIYAAIRIVDNGGMLNVNTAYKFDPNVGPADADLIDGSSQMQINLAALALRGDNGGLDAAAEDLQEERCGQESTDLDSYEENVIWRYDRPDGNYTPFDISDELELRNRFLLDQHYTKARIEDKDKLWSDAFWGTYYLWTPVDGSGGIGLDDWFYKAQNDIQDPNAMEPEKDYSYRHISTTYNMDRIINPSGKKMLNINTVSVADYKTIKEAFTDSNLVDVNGVAAQVTVNLIDFRDSDSSVTSINVDGTTYYGFEQPCVYISELAHKFLVTEAGGGPPASDTWRSYAVELYKPYTVDACPEPNSWRLFIDNSAASLPGNVPVLVNWSGTQGFHVIKWENTYTVLDVDPCASSQDILNVYNEIFGIGSIISLQRRNDVNDVWITVDSHVVPGDLSDSGWLVAEDGTAVSIERDIKPHKCIRRLWASVVEASTPTLGADNNYFSSDPNVIQAHPANTDFTNVGEIGMVLRKSAYSEGPDTIGLLDTEADVRINLAESRYQSLFQYLTVFDPANDGIDNDGDTLLDNADFVGVEWKVPGRININTAPWFVLAQLPWMQYTAAGDDYKRAQRIADNGPYKNIGELMRVAEMRSLASDNLNQVGFPDLTTPDHPLGGAVDDFEERDLIFARISDLVTVRSDVFTAYILVRIGTDGPQKRVMAILDRSSVYSPTDRVKIVAVHPVADPR